MSRYGSANEAPTDEVEPRMRFETRAVTTPERLAENADGGIARLALSDAGTSNPWLGIDPDRHKCV